jgi:DNA-binding NarL/FixJ family response regulator
MPSITSERRGAGTETETRDAKARAHATSPDRHQPISVVVADDYPAIREIVRLACETRPNIEVIGEAGEGNQALQLCLDLEPDVVLLDIMMPGLNGLEVARRLREQGTRTRILVLSVRDDQEALFEAMRLGVDGYLDKTIPEERIVSSIEAVAAGGAVFSGDQERRAFTQLGNLIRRAQEQASAQVELTQREREVLTLISQGLTTHQMASRMKVSNRTIESHISKLYRKLNVRTRVQAVVRAAALGLLDLGGEARA